VYEPKLVLISLLIKLGVAAAVSAVTARALAFQRLLFAERRTTAQTIGLLAFLCIPLTLGVWIRFVVQNFYAADISFETVIILGILLGPLSAMFGGAVLSIPAMLNHEYLTLPFLLAVATVSGLYGRAVEPEEVWSFYPFVDLTI
jgi:two-component system LytT family sensor kinase